MKLSQRESWSAEDYRACAIARHVVTWHECETPLELIEFLGWTWEEYAAWLAPGCRPAPDKPLPFPPGHT